MTTPSTEQLQKQALEYVKQGQEAITSMFSAFSENLAALAPGGSSGAPGPLGALGSFPRPEEAVDQLFDLGVQVLEAQRALAHGMLEAAGPALRAAESAIDSTVSTVDRARTR